jgi:hypothetical protein
MAKKKTSSPVKAKPKAEPPPDNPQLRHQESIDLDARAMAEKRLEALRKIRESSGS